MPLRPLSLPYTCWENARRAMQEEEEAVETLKEKLDAAKQEKATCLQRLLDIESEVGQSGQ